VKPYGVSIEQHGITGTPVNLLDQFRFHGIRKGNVGTNWQNVAHACLPEELMERMKKWAQENNQNIKMATKPFLEEINSIPQKYISRTPVRLAKRTFSKKSVAVNLSDREDIDSSVNETSFPNHGSTCNSEIIICSKKNSVKPR